jgi:hypothetical protein
MQHAVDDRPRFARSLINAILGSERFELFVAFRLPLEVGLPCLCLSWIGWGSAKRHVFIVALVT